MAKEKVVQQPNLKQQRESSALGQALVALGVDVMSIRTYRMEDLTPDDVKAISALQSPLVRLVLGHHRLDLYRNGSAYYRVGQGKARIPSTVSHADVEMREEPTVRLRALKGLPFSRGVTAIVAQGGFGKTPLLKSIAAGFKKQGLHTRSTLFGEPRGRYLSDYYDLLIEMLMALLNGEHMFIDSLKNPVYDLPGGLAGGGVSTALWPTLSDISSVFDRCGLCCVALVNPSSSDLRVITNMNQGVTSNTCGIIASATKGTWVGEYREISDESKVEFEFVSTGEEFSYSGYGAVFDDDLDASTGTASSKQSTPNKGGRLTYSNLLVEALQKMIDPSTEITK